MRYQYPFFNKKLLLGGFILIFLLFWGFVRAEIYYDTWPMPLTTNHFFTLESGTNFYTFQFTAKESFDVEWREISGGRCIQDINNGYEKFKITAPAIYYGTKNDEDLDEHFYLINVDNIGMFAEAGGSCNTTEHYEAGETYQAYLVEGSYIYSIYKNYTGQDILDNSVIDFDWGYDFEYDQSKLRQEYAGNLYDSPYNLSLNKIPMLNILIPQNNAEVLSNFNLNFEYNNAENWDRLLVVFEDWNASSTCPAQFTEEYDEEYNKGWFNDQSLPSFSDFFDNASGTMSMEIRDLDIGDYNCIRCVFINETAGVMSDELCPDFHIKVVSYGPPPDTPDFYLPIGTWENYYQEHSERFASSTPLFSTLAGVFEPLISWAGNLTIYFNDNFEKTTAMEKGAEFGKKIPQARGYVETINTYFGDLPISDLFLFFLITAVAVLIFRIVRIILTIIVP